jgi:phage shock protein E
MNGIAILFGVLFIVIAYWLYNYAMDSQYRISAETAKKLLATKQIDAVIDVRTMLERNTMGFYPGSIHIPSQELRQKIPAMYPDKSARLFVYCNTGQRARAATEILQGMGYTHTVYVASGHTSLMS